MPDPFAGASGYVQDQRTSKSTATVNYSPRKGPGGASGAVSPQATRASKAYAEPEWVMYCRLSLFIERVNQRPLARWWVLSQRIPL
jgi:hypothetical protein